MSRQEIAVVMAKYVPVPAVDICTDWIIRKNIHLKITRGRSSKYGDYMPLSGSAGHRITLNHDMNPYAFLITFIHEVAHLHTYEKYRRRHEPHGREWKHEFSLLLRDFLSMKIFPADISEALHQYVKNPAASSCRDYRLSRALKNYDKTKAENVVHLEDLTTDSLFRFYKSRNNQVFKKGPKLRTRYQCIELRTKQVYWANPLAEVISTEPLTGHSTDG